MPARKIECTFPEGVFFRIVIVVAHQESVGFLSRCFSFLSGTAKEVRILHMHKALEIWFGRGNSRKENGTLIA